MPMKRTDNLGQHLVWVGNNWVVDYQPPYAPVGQTINTDDNTVWDETQRAWVPAGLTTIGGLSGEPFAGQYPASPTPSPTPTPYMPSTSGVSEQKMIQQAQEIANAQRLGQTGVGTAGVGTAGVGTTGAGGITPAERAEASYTPYIAYLNALGLGTKRFLSPGEKYQEAQIGPISNLYDIRGLMSAESGLNAMGFGETTPTTFAQSGVADPVLRNREAMRMAEAILGATPEQRGEEFSFEPGIGFGDTGQNVLEQDGIDRLTYLLGQGLQARYGRLGAQSIARQLQRAAQQALAARAATGAEPKGMGEDWLTAFRQRQGF